MLTVTLNLSDPDAIDALVVFLNKLANIQHHALTLANNIPLAADQGRPPAVDAPARRSRTPKTTGASAVAPAPVAGEGLPGADLAAVQGEVAASQTLTTVEARLRLQKVLGDSEDRRKRAAAILKEQFSVDSLAKLDGEGAYQFVSTVEREYA
jgi:hypothetical protein